MKDIVEGSLTKLLTLIKGVIDTKITNPSGGTTGQVLTKTASGEAWSDGGGGGLSLNGIAQGDGTNALLFGNTTNNTAAGDYSLATNYNTIASSNNQTVIGKYNAETTDAFIIGNGTSSVRSNAMTVDWSGNAILAGKVTVGIAPTADMDVATKQYADTVAGTKITNPSGGTAGQVLTKTDSGEAWESVSSGNPSANTVATATAAGTTISLTLPDGETASNGKHISFSAPCASTGIIGVKINGQNSNDAITWASSTLPSSTVWTDIIYGNEKFVAISPGYHDEENPEESIDQKIIYSIDGITWIEAEIPSQIYGISSIAYGNGKFIAVGSPDNYIYSTNGITWEISSAGFDEYYSSNIVYGNDKFIITQYNYENEEGRTIYSTDGTNWLSTDLSGREWSTITYGNGKFVAVGNDTLSIENYFAYSTNGINWTQPEVFSEEETYCTDIAYGNGKFIVIATAYDESSNSTAFYTTDCVNWNQVTLLNKVNHIAFGNGKFIATGDENIAIYSTDGETWTTSTLPHQDCQYQAITYGNDTFVTIGSDKVAYCQTTLSYQLVNAEGNAYVVNGGSWSSDAYLTITMDCTNNKAYIINEHNNLLPALPTADGTYTLKLTVTSGAPAYSWIQDT